ncbi:hypothetical protein C8R46DRAFT_1202496 [Mycena filopes]|nr:hypothetical protein C8R46DRAFT_1202496 [Mycena filopes]
MARPGDVCIAENVSVELPFLNRLVPAMGAEAPTSARIRLAKLRDPTKTKGKDRRPCVVLPDILDPDRAGSICLMATFEGSHPSSLPYIYQDFIVPVHPYLSAEPQKFIGPKGREFSTKPNPVIQASATWKTKDDSPQWIIALDISLKTDPSQSLPSWSSVEMNDGAHFDRTALLQLGDICYTKGRGWERLLKSKSFAKWCYRDIMDSNWDHHTLKTANESTRSTTGGSFPYAGSMNHSQTSIASSIASESSNFEPSVVAPAAPRPQPTTSSNSWSLPRTLRQSPRVPVIPETEEPNVSASILPGIRVSAGALDTIVEVEEPALLTLRSKLSQASLRTTAPRSPSRSSFRAPSLRSMSWAEAVTAPESPTPISEGWTVKVKRVKPRERRHR